MSRPVALVTGGSRGIGRAVAIELGRRGCAVAVNYVSDDVAAKEVVAEIEASDGAAQAFQADVGNAADVDRCFTDIEDALGAVEILVNNAGVRRDGLALSMKDEAWDEVLRTNLYGTFACCRRALLPMVRARRGRIINIASVSGLRGSPGQANYAAAKAGVVALSRTLAREVGGKGITVNVVAPGLIATDLTSGLSAERFEGLVSEIPQRRAGEPAEIAALVGFLSSDEAVYLNGSVLVADGGLIA